MQKNKKVFASFEVNSGFIFIDIDTIVGFYDEIWNNENSLLIRTTHKDLKTGKFYKEVRNLKQFLEVYPDDDREYKMEFGRKYFHRFVNDVPTDYFDWAVKSWNKELERNEREKIFKKLSLEDCLALTKIAEEIHRQEVEKNDNL